MTYRTCLLFGFVVAPTMTWAQPQPLPTKINLVPEVERAELAPRAQGKRDTCSLFAITALAEFESARVTKVRGQSFSEEFLIWAGRTATAHKQEQAMFYEAVQGLNSFGICTQALMPYEKTTENRHKPSAAALADAKARSGRWQVNWIKRWDVQAPLTDEQMTAIKQALARGHPVACGLRWPKSLQGHEILTVPGRDHVFDGHSIALVGYENTPNRNGGGVFRFRNSDGPAWGDHGYGFMSYAYVRAYANDALWLHFGAADSEVPLVRFQAESLPVLAQERCDAHSQDMRDFGALLWSGGKQLYCGAQKDGYVTLGFSMERGGRYRLRALGTAAPDYGIIRAALDNKEVGSLYDLYSGRVSPAGSLELGVHEFAAGRHTLRFTVVGKNLAAGNYYFGLDTIDLLPAR